MDLHAELTKRCDRFPLYSQEAASDPEVCAKLFFIAGSATWYVTEYDPETRIGFGYVTGFAADEWGYFSISEMQATRFAGICAFEVDLYFESKKASTVGVFK